MNKAIRTTIPLLRIPALRLPALLLLMSSALLIVLAIQFLFPGQAVYESQYAGVSIHFYADRAAVFAYGDCVQVRWDVQDIREVYYDDQGVTGSGISLFCVTGSAMPTLRVVFQDGSEQTIRLYIRTLIERAEVWSVVTLAVTMAGLSLITALLNRPRDLQMPRRTAFDRLLMGIGGAVVLVVWTFTLLEIILRLYFAVFGTHNQQIAYVYSRDQINQLQASIIPLPGVEIGSSPYAAGNNTLGMRGEEVSVAKPDGVYRIIAMGDSTTFGLLVAPQDAYPAQLERVLREEYGYSNVEVLNAGVSSYTSFQIMSNFETRYLALDPDLVIFYAANNDAMTRDRAPDCYAGENALRGLDPSGQVATNRINEPLSPSVLYRFFSIQIGLEPDPSSDDSLYTSTLVECGQGQPDETMHNVALNPPIYYQRNLMTIAGIAQIHQIQLMFATWTIRSNAQNIDPIYRAAVEENNQIMREVAAAHEIPLFDFAPIMTQEENYWQDFMHMNADGLREQAEAFAAYIDARGWIPRPS